ncbi:MAG: hypothetical protein NTZ49_02445 [Candidatus Parcubacteria bacterium]|nr:hypothetical protein [Candidatus Parcubacteria bacterium]
MLEQEDLKQIEIIINSALDSKLTEKLEPIKQELADIRVELKIISQRLDSIGKA